MCLVEAAQEAQALQEARAAQAAQAVQAVQAALVVLAAQAAQVALAAQVEVVQCQSHAVLTLMIMDWEFVCATVDFINPEMPAFKVLLVE